MAAGFYAYGWSWVGGGAFAQFRVHPGADRRATRGGDVLARHVLGLETTSATPPERPRRSLETLDRGEVGEVVRFPACYLLFPLTDRTWPAKKREF
jgi:hypothetical protein